MSALNNTIKVMTWNIHGAANPGWERKIKVEKVDLIMAQNADIFVLTEFVVMAGIDYLFQQMKEKGYIWFYNSETGKNGILIAVKEKIIRDLSGLSNSEKKDWIEKKKDLTGSIYKDKLVVSSAELGYKGCNLLRVKIPIKDKFSLSVVGFRMDVEIQKTDEERWKEYRKRKEYFEKLLPFFQNEVKNMNENDLYILCGDFNNAQCREKLIGNYDENNNVYKTKSYDQQEYNLNYIKQKLNNQGFYLADINMEKENNNKANSFGYATWNKIPDDHIFYHGFTNKEGEVPIEVIEVKDFEKRYDMVLSDHDILIADLNY